MAGLLRARRNAQRHRGPLNAAIAGALKSDELKPKLIANALVPGGGSPEELERLVRTDYERWGKIVRERNIASD